ncbi:MAG: 30S ribosomal protein S8 [Candidatus Kerfeldbacteria bacterium]|nr:30S ribosomal protein S8 [Candidatus Kerfeldbacteria bacterium]
MPMTDPIADMLTRIRNALTVRKATVSIPYSRVKHEIAEILTQEGWLSGATVEQDGQRPLLRVQLKYGPDGRPVLQHLERVSKPGRRVYVGQHRMPVVLNNIGLAILSTSQGIMTSHDARKAKVGGEVLCEVY